MKNHTQMTEEAYKEAGAHLLLAYMGYLANNGTDDELCACLGSMGSNLLRQGQYTNAVSYFDRALQFGRRTWWWCLREQALAYRGQSDGAQAALRCLLDACQVVEKSRSQMMSSENRTTFFAEHSLVFRDLVEFLVRPETKELLILFPELPAWSVSSRVARDQIWLEAAMHYCEAGKNRSLIDAVNERKVLRAAHPDVQLLSEDQELSHRISKLTAVPVGLDADQANRHEELTGQINALQQRRSQIEVEIKKATLGSYIAPTYRKPMEMARELPSGTAVLEYSVGEKDAWLLLMTRSGITAHRLGADTAALPELHPRQQATLAQLVDAWNVRPDKVGLEGWVRLARARAEDLAKPESERHGLVNSDKEQAILEGLGRIVLPESAQAELKRQGMRHLLVVPDGPLHYLPLGMVRLKGPANSQYLVEQFAASSVPALTTLEAIRKQRIEREKRRKGPGKELLAFANPVFGADRVVKASDEMVTRVRGIRNDYYTSGGLRLRSLPETETEAIRVASLFGLPRECKSPTSDWPEGPVLVFAGKGASELQVKRLFGGLANSSNLNPQPSTRARYLLFGTHGFADERNGMLSCLALSSSTADSEEDGFLQAQEVLELQLDTDLVMLSACQTGLGQMHAGEGLVGLSASFFIAGAESVCASLWQVPSGPTTQLTTEFFRHLKEGKMDRAKALRQAQLTVLRHGRSLDGKPADYSSPYCWAAFVLGGE
jgi:CHAT domain-containing protein